MINSRLTDKKNFLNKNRLRLLFGVPFIMFGFGFAMVPFYNVLCRNLGINGKTAEQAASRSAGIDRSRSIRIEFITQTNEYLPYEFFPRIKHITLHPGENILIYFEAKNQSNRTLTIQAIPSVSPGSAAKYLRKTECFCFTQQTFKGGEHRVMPVLFHIDPKLPPEIHTVTLAYTLFKVNKRRIDVPAKVLGRIV